MKGSFDLVFISGGHRLVFTPRWSGQSSLTGHYVSDSAAVLHVVLQESLLVPPPLARGEGAVSTLWLLETVHCSSLLVPPPWSVEKTISASVAAVMLSVGSVVFLCVGIHWV